MSVLSVLFTGRTRLSEIGWCQGAHARQADGKLYRFDWSPTAPAASYSAHGAVGGHDVLDMMHARVRLWQTLGDGQRGFASLSDWNDAPERTREEVVALYEATIAGMVS